MKHFRVDLDRIEQNENSRVVYKEADLAELMGSMKQDGLLQPVGVRRIGADKWEAVFGNRRIMAAKKLGWGEIDAVLVEAENDVDRDVLGLIENLKRQNTTVAEDGRMFQVLVDRGLSRAEIAARLGVNVTRVDTALEVFNDFPKEFHKKIVNKVGGSPLKDRISASTAHAVINLRKTHNLNRKQMRSILTKASEGASVQQISQVAPLMASGLTFDAALKSAQRLRHVQLSFFMDGRAVDKVEKETGKSIAQLLLDVLEKHSKQKIYRGLKAGEYRNKILPRDREKVSA